MADEGAILVVAIDGPAGSGKSTVARRLADRLDLSYLDTGAMYRAVTLAALRQGLDPESGASTEASSETSTRAQTSTEQAIAEVARGVEIELAADGTVVVDGVESTAEIRGPDVNAAVSAVAANREVRRELVDRQRRWARARGGGVLEGRDIGTVVFPDADLKVYLTASPEVRARRRAGELGVDQPATNTDVATVAQDLARRDTYDSQRAHDPLRLADDAKMVDTSDLDIDAVIELLIEMLPGIGP